MQDNHKFKNVYMAGYQVCVTTVANPLLLYISLTMKNLIGR